LLVCLPAEDAAAYCHELAELNSAPAWIVRRVVADPGRKARIVPDATKLEMRC